VPAGPSAGSWSIRSPLEGRLVRLRAAEEADLPRWRELIFEPEVIAHLATAWPTSLAETRAWWASAREGAGAVLAIETLAGELVGGCDIRDVDLRSRSAWLGIFIGLPYHDRGFGTEAVRLLCRFAFREMNLQRMALDVYVTNPRARHVYAGLGFKEEGMLRRAHFEDGRHVDVVVMGLLAEEFVDA
jgi:RimJ/RimL family protein N-acetyltransferase